jgi:hypothetical protein
MVSYLQNIATTGLWKDKPFSTIEKKVTAKKRRTEMTSAVILAVYFPSKHMDTAGRR